MTLIAHVEPIQHAEAVMKLGGAGVERAKLHRLPLLRCGDISRLSLSPCSSSPYSDTASSTSSSASPLCRDLALFLLRAAFLSDVDMALDVRAEGKTQGVPSAGILPDWSSLTVNMSIVTPLF